MSPDDERTDWLDAWRDALGPWHPRPLDVPGPPMPRMPRVALFAAIVLGHALVLFGLDASSRLSLRGEPVPVTTLVFIAPAAPPPQPRARREPEPEREARREPRPRVAVDRTVRPSPAARPGPAPATSSSASTGEPASPDGPASSAPVSRADGPLRLYDPDGSLALPDDVVEQIADVESEARAFDFQRPGLMESGRFLDRPPVLAYEATRFDQYWIPEQGVLTEILEKAVKATTGTVEIPIPGTRGGKLVCSVSLLAFGGGCGVANNSDGYVVSLDDPTTLSPAEDAQCRAWWDQIVAAGDQDTWRRTRELYDFSCRKPLARDDAPPDGPPAAG